VKACKNEEKELSAGLRSNPHRADVVALLMQFADVERADMTLIVIRVVSREAQGNAQDTSQERSARRIHAAQFYNFKLALSRPRASTRCMNRWPEWRERI
jgi:hypothetical protein